MQQERILQSHELALCSYVLLAASSLDGALGGICERSMDKAVVGMYDVEESLSSRRSGLLRCEGLWSNASKLAGCEDGRRQE